MSDAYDDEFYRERHAKTIYAAEQLLGIVDQYVPHIGSAVDVGCGVGTWLHVLQQRGAEVQGIDGPWVDRDALKIPPACFQEHDLTQPLEPSRRFDLAISLEVAEHLPPASADAFVTTLTRLADAVLFSAAIPDQGGVSHVNEQWPAYWSERFAAQGFLAFDVLRSRVWNDREIPFWYRQNAVLYVARAALPQTRLRAEDAQVPLPLVHPEQFSAYVSMLADCANQAPSVMQSVTQLARSLKVSVARRVIGKN